MRTLPTVDSAAFVQVAARLRLVYPQGDNDTFTEGDILPGTLRLSQEVPFGGGAPKPATLGVTLATSLGWVQRHLTRLPGTRAHLTVLANSEAFNPFGGVVRGVDLDLRDPGLVRLSLVDYLLDTDPLIPPVAVVGSWPSVHPADLNKGAPLYYGIGRPVYAVAVDCLLQTLLFPAQLAPPQPLQFRDTNLVPNSLDGAYLFTHALVNTVQQMVQGTDFWCVGCGPGAAQHAVDSFGRYPYGNYLYNISTLIDSSAASTACLSFADEYLTYKNFPGGADYLGARVALTPVYNDLRSVGWANLDLATQKQVNCLFFTSLYPAGLVNGALKLVDGNGAVTCTAWSVASGITQTLVVSVAAPPAFMSGGVQSNYLDLVANSAGYWAAGGWGVSNISIAMLLASARYREYSVFGAAPGAPSVSVNPWAILDNLLTSYVKLPFRQDQSSACQQALANSGWSFSALFYERTRGTSELFTTVLDEWAKLTGVIPWVGDSGMLHARMYQESGLATVNSLPYGVDRAVTTSDIVAGQVLLNPLGTTGWKTQAAHTVALDWNYDYQLRAYRNNLYYWPGNSALCTSADAAGVSKDYRLQTRYIVDSATALLALQNRLRFETQAPTYVDLDLPACFFGLELADVLNVQHPSLPGCAGNFQVTRLDVAYLEGTVKVKAASLLALIYPGAAASSSV